jgi:hypothetical protein
VRRTVQSARRQYVTAPVTQAKRPASRRTVSRATPLLGGAARRAGCSHRPRGKGLCSPRTTQRPGWSASAACVTSHPLARAELARDAVLIPALMFRRRLCSLATGVPAGRESAVSPGSSSRRRPRTRSPTSRARRALDCATSSAQRDRAGCRSWRYRAQPRGPNPRESRPDSRTRDAGAPNVDCDGPAAHPQGVTRRRVMPRGNRRGHSPS